MRQGGVVGAGGKAAVLVLHHRHRVHIAAGGHHCLGVCLRDTLQVCLLLYTLRGRFKKKNGGQFFSCEK